MQHRYYTQEEIDIVKDPNLSLEEKCALTGRTEKAIITKQYFLKRKYKRTGNKEYLREYRLRTGSFKYYNNWTKEDEDLIITYKGKDTDLVDKIGHSVYAIATKRYRLNKKEKDVRI